MRETVEVSQTGAAAQFTTLARYATSSAAGYALGAGWINGDVQQALVSIAGIVAPLVWGWLATRRNVKLKADVATGSKALMLKGGR